MFQVPPVGLVLLKIVKNCQWVAALPSNSVLLTQIIRKNALGLRSLPGIQRTGVGGWKCKTQRIRNRVATRSNHTVHSSVSKDSKSAVTRQTLQTWQRRQSIISQNWAKATCAPPPLRAEQDATRRQTRRKIRADSRRLKIGLLRPSFSRSDNAVLAILLIWNENVIFPEKMNQTAERRNAVRLNQIRWNMQIIKYSNFPDQNNWIQLKFKKFKWMKSI